MKVECSVEKLKSALHHAERITGKNLTLPILSSILIIAREKSIKLRATNLSLGIEIEIPAKIEKEGIVAVGGNLISNIFSTITENGNVILESIDNHVSISTKNSTLKVNCFPHDDFPTIPVIEGDEISISSKKLIEGVKSVYYSSSPSDIKPEIASVYIYQDGDHLVFVATDSFRLAEKKIKYSFNKDFPGILIPYKNISEIIKIFDDGTGDITLVSSKNQVSFKSNGYYLTSRAIDGLFPDYKQIIPKEFKTEAIVLKHDLINALKISNIFSDKFNQVILILNPKDKKCVITSKNSDIGEHQTSIGGSFEGENIEISFNYKYFIDCFQSISSDSVTIKLNQPNKPMVVNGSNDSSFLYLIMPMNR